MRCEWSVPGGVRVGPLAVAGVEPRARRATSACLVGAIVVGLGRGREVPRVLLPAPRVRIGVSVETAIRCRRAPQGRGRVASGDGLSLLRLDYPRWTDRWAAGCSRNRRIGLVPTAFVRSSRCRAASHGRSAARRGCGPVPRFRAGFGSVLGDWEGDGRRLWPEAVQPPPLPPEAAARPGKERPQLLGRSVQWCSSSRDPFCSGSRRSGPGGRGRSGATTSTRRRNTQRLHSPR